MKPKRVRPSDIKRHSRPLIIPLFSNLDLQNIIKHSDYLYEVTYGCTDYDFAFQWFKENAVDLSNIACTSVRKGNWYGRNFDWFYNHDCDFVIKTKCDEVIPSIGVAGSMSSLNKTTMTSGASAESLKLLPFYTLDGINKAGVFINSNVVPQDKGKVIKTECTEEEEHEMFLLMWPRFVLDHFETALEAVEYAQKHISFFQTKQASQYGYDIHFMIGDANKTYVCEIINNKFEYIEKEIMANFHVIGTEFNEDGKLYTPVTQDDIHNAMDTNKVTKHGSGLERHNIVIDNIDNANTKEGMVNLMHNLLNYNNSYIKTGNDTWYTEFVGTYPSGEYTVKTPASKFEEKVMPTARGWFENRDRNTNPQPVWHTTHTSVYDLENKKLYIYDSTEDGIEHEFSLCSKEVDPSAPIVGEGKADYMILKE